MQQSLSLQSGRNSVENLPTRFSRLELTAPESQQTHQVFGQNHMEENSKLNELISEYRRENERCSQRIGELQRKLDLNSASRGGR